jgi:branched-chain amino acid transport system ATP-binding protein
MFLNAENMLGGYGETTILNGCSISVEKGEIAVIVGPNGAGKSTAMRAIFGMLNLQAGKVVFDNQDITSLKPQERVGKGCFYLYDSSGKYGNRRLHKQR